MYKHQSIVKYVDHISILVHDIRELFSFFTDTLNLPVVWPVASYGPILSGIVSVGNANIEVFQYGSQKKVLKENIIRARIYAIAFGPHDLLTSLSQLAARDIPHSPPIPLWGSTTDGYRGKLWTNILIGGLLGRRSFTFQISRLLRGNTNFSRIVGMLIGWISGIRWAQSFIRKALGENIILLTEYNHRVSHASTDIINQHGTQDSRSLGIIAVKEVIIGLQNFEEKLHRWQDLISPNAPTAQGVWQLGQGPVIRLVPASLDSIQTLLLRIRSLDQARDFLARKNFLGKVSDDHISIDPIKIQGLDIRLVV